MAHNAPFMFGGGQNTTNSTPSQQPAPSNPQPNSNRVPAASAQNQEMAFQQNAALPGVDITSVLQNISPQQLAAIAQLFAAGKIPLPAPPPGLTQSATPSAAPPVAQQPAATPPQNKPDTNVDVDMDKEEGELEEGEVGDTSAPRAFLHTPPKGPRKRSRSPRSRPPAETILRQGSFQSTRLDDARPSIMSRKTSSGQATPVANGKPKSQQPARHSTIKTFITEMHRAGFGFDEVAREVKNQQALHQLYQKLGVPTAPVAKPSPPKAAVPSHAIPTPVGDVRKPSLPKKPVPAKSGAPQDRSSYLAKLQAAKGKNAKPSSATTTTPPPLSIQQAPPVPAAEDAQPAQQAKRAHPMTVQGREAMNKLIREKLAVLAANKKKKDEAKDGQKSSSDEEGPAPAPSNGPEAAAKGDSDLDTMQDVSGQLESHSAANAPHHVEASRPIEARPQQLSTATSATPGPASPAVNQGFAIPGLFTTATSSFGTATQPQYSSARSQLPDPARPALSRSQSQASTSHQNQPAIRLAPKRKADSAVLDGSGATKRPFGQGKADEPFVIIDSDDAESDDEAKTASTKKDLSASHPENVRGAALGSLNDFPPKVNSLTASGASTPRTPAALDEDYRKQLAAIDAEKRRLAEVMARQEKRKAAIIGSRAPSNGSQPIPATNSNDSPSSSSLEVNGTDTSVNISKRLQDKEAQAAELRGKIANAGLKTATVMTSPSQAPAASYATEVGQTSNGNSDALDSGEDADFYEPRTDADATATAFAQSNAVPNEPFHREAIITNVSADTSALAQTFESPASPLKDNVADGPAEIARGLGTNSTTDPLVDVEGSESLRRGVGAAAEDRTILSGQADGQEDADDNDDDDMDDVYDPPTSTRMNIQKEPLIETPQDTGVGVSSPETESSEASEPEAASNANAHDKDDNDEGSVDESEDDSDEAMDTSEPSTSPSDHVVDDGPALESEARPLSAGELSPSVAAPDAMDQAHDTNYLTNNDQVPADELAPELQPSPEELTVPTHESPRQKTSFTPYESPLSRFKDYRYHPQFLGTVPGGFKSMTFSHKIDPVKPMCPFETAGGKCNDKTCTHQHFRTMNLTDNDLLKLMGTEHTPARTAEEQIKWKSGLSAVVQELRGSNRGKDVGAIAQRIAEFRREFIGDPTKTLVLD